MKPPLFPDSKDIENTLVHHCMDGPWYYLRSAFCMNNLRAYTDADGASPLPDGDPRHKVCPVCRARSNGLEMAPPK